MAIDADMNSGLISEDQARKRRKEIEREADFYGAMDGASKFVRGDAIAGILITVINIIGGLSIGVFQRGLDVGTAAELYTLMTIGDGLVTQIPSLIVSTAAGIVAQSTAEKLPDGTTKPPSAARDGGARDADFLLSMVSPLCFGCRSFPDTPGEFPVPYFICFLQHIRF